MKSSGLKAETECFTVAAQDQSLTTRAYRNKILNNGTDPKCRLYHEEDETAGHILAECTALPKTE